MSSQELSIGIEYLFNRPWDEDLTEAEEEVLEEKAEALVSEYGWDAVYRTFTDYLYSNCSKPEDAINAACCFWNYHWENRIVPTPYVLLSYFYYRINLDEQKYDSQGILDSLAIEILPKAGVSKADLVQNPYYSPVLDDELLQLVEQWKTGANLFAQE